MISANSTNDLSARRREKVLVLASTFPRWPGDSEPPFVFELCRRLSTRLDVQVLAPHAPGAKTEENMDGVVVKRYWYFWPRFQSLAYEGGIMSRLRRNRARYLQVPFFFAAQLIAVIMTLRREKIDVVHAHWIIPQGIVAALAKSVFGAQTPILCTTHGGDLFGLRGRAFQHIKRFVLMRCDALTVVSHAMRAPALYLGASEKKIKVISMGVDLRDRFVPSGEIRRGRQLLFVGRLVEKKGLTYLLQAMPKVLSRHQDTKLVVAGSGPEESDLRAEAARLGVAKAVEFLGAISNQALPPLYQEAAVVVFPSVTARDGDQEGFGLVLAEALGCEAPVVISDLDAMRDMVTDGVSGFVVPQKDACALAAKIIHLLDNPRTGQQFGRAGREHVLRQFDWKTIADEYAELLLDVMQCK